MLLGFYVSVKPGNQNPRRRVKDRSRGRSMPLVSTSPRRSCRRWRFTWESLAHTPTLRLFLFSSEVEPSERCESLEASLCLGESRVVVRWREEGSGDLELRVPVPRVLIDPVAPVQVLSRKDHIEVKLVLVLPLDHPMSMNSRSALDEGALFRRQEGDCSGYSVPFSLDSGEPRHFSVGSLPRFVFISFLI